MHCMPSSYQSNTVISLLIKQCSTTTSIRKARQLHALLLTTPTISNPPTPFLNNNLLSMYAKCNSIKQSQVMFDQMPHRNLVSYNALISGYTRCHGCADMPFQLLSRMVFEGLRPNGLTFTSLLQAASLRESSLVGTILHGLAVKFGFSNDVCVETSLVGMYSKCGDPESANGLFGHMVDRDSVAWNSIMIGNLKNDRIEKGLELFGSMIRSGVTPTQYTYSMILNSCGRIVDYINGRVVHAHVILSGMVVDLPLQNALLDMYCSFGDVKVAFTIFCRIDEPDLVSWNSMIAGYSSNGDGERATDLFVQFLRDSSAKPDDYTFASVISRAGASTHSDYGKALHSQVTKSGYDQSVYVGSTLVSMYMERGETECAQRVFSLILKKDAVLWTEMITGQCKAGNAEKAVQFFYGMHQEGHEIDSFALSVTLSACADLATLMQGEILHSQALKTGYDVDMSVSGSLVDMYAKNGQLQNAQAIFSQVVYPDLKCWNSMLGGYGHHGKALEAFHLFEELLRYKIRPDEITYISLLSACSNCGLVDKGKYLWLHMKEQGIVPGMKHYSCMVSLLSRAGLFQEAEELIYESGFSEHSVDLWRTLLSSCVSKRNLKVGIHAAEQVLKSDPNDSATHILLSNLYASSGRWDGVAETRGKTRGLMVEKDPGISWTEFTNNIHVFSSGDQSHSDIVNVKAELHRLEGNMKLKAHHK